MRVVESKVVFTEENNGKRQHRGFEHQRYVFRADKTISLSVFSVAQDKGISRDVIVNLDAKWRPIDSYVRIHLGSRVEGCGWFRFSEDKIVADLWNHDTGDRRQSVELDSPVVAFGAHPIATDMLLAAPHSRLSDAPVQLLSNLFLSSAHHFGATGPEIAPVMLEVEYLGTDRVAAVGQTFDTDHWRILKGNSVTGHSHPGEEFWTLRDSFVFVQAHIPAIGYTYTLTNFSDSER